MDASFAAGACTRVMPNAVQPDSIVVSDTTSCNRRVAGLLALQEDRESERVGVSDIDWEDDACDQDRPWNMERVPFAEMLRLSSLVTRI